MNVRRVSSRAHACGVTKFQLFNEFLEKHNGMCDGIDKQNVRTLSQRTKLHSH